MKIGIKNILICCGTLLCLNGCDLDTNPTTSYDGAKVYQDTKNAESVLEGVWKRLFEDYGNMYTMGFYAHYCIMDAMGSDIVVNETRTGYKNYYAFSVMNSKSEYAVSYYWGIFYEAINNCNNVIAFVDDAKGSEEDISRIKGQAYALRGFLYMTLASKYCTSIDKDPNTLCVPIYTEPSTYQTEGQSRATVTAVYEQALSDMNEAEKLIPDAYMRSGRMEKYRIDKQVVYGLLARTHLYARHWADAEKFSVLAHQNKALMSEADYMKGFNDAGNAEWIWGHPQIDTQNDAGYVFFFLSLEETAGYRNFAADPYFMNLFDNTDYRKKMFKVFNLWNVNYLGYTKFRFREGTNGDLPLMRLSEMYLIEAEAKARQVEKVGQALDVINAFKRARGATELVSESQPQLIEDILKERRKELWGEGFSLVDMIRNQKSVERESYAGDVRMSDGSLLPATVKGHWSTQFPDGTTFQANSLYYIWSAPENEGIYNPNFK